MSGGSPPEPVSEIEEDATDVALINGLSALADLRLNSKPNELARCESLGYLLLYLPVNNFPY